MDIKSIESDYPGNLEVSWRDGSGLALRDYAPVSGIGDLAVGQTVTLEDGGTVTRVDSGKLVWWTPAASFAA